MNIPMSNSGSVSFCIQNFVILFTQTKHEQRNPHFTNHLKNHTLSTSNGMSYYDNVLYIIIYLKVILTAMVFYKIMLNVLLQ